MALVGAAVLVEGEVPVASASPTGRVYWSSFCATTSGQRKLFQEPRNVMMPRAARAGLVIGRTIRQRIGSSPHPSMRAASISSSGSDRMNCHMRNTPKGAARNGGISPSRESLSPMFVTSTYRGTKVTRPGTMGAARTRVNTAIQPRNPSFASAWPSIEQNSRLPVVTTTATRTELVNMPTSRVRRTARRIWYYFATVVASGRHLAPDATGWWPYPTEAAHAEVAERSVELTAVPYYAWVNRGHGAMRVWMPGLR